MGVQEIIVETNTMLVRDALSGDNYKLSTVGGLVTEMKFFISAELRSCNLSVCKHDCNMVAHALATVLVYSFATSQITMCIFFFF